ncbi:MAG: ABC transporter substrate-binding protein [Nitrospirae bacterium]|nr:ABC transporter substrate-binding protein [Nitrospirota bacterium]
MKIRLIVIICLLLLPVNLYAAGKIIVLYPAVSPILSELGVTKQVVGTTSSDETFKDTVKIGSHLKPNIEIITSLKPDLIIAGSKMTWPEEMRKSINSEVFYYNPKTLNEILEKITELGILLNAPAQAAKLNEKLKAQLSAIKPISKKITVIYEVTENPLRTAGIDSIENSIIETAGGINLIKIEKKNVPISIEKVIELNPDLYIYQIGPMNKSPQKPQDRYQFKSLKSKFLSVNELEFARPGINSFDETIKLNKFFQGLCP